MRALVGDGTLTRRSGHDHKQQFNSNDLTSSTITAPQARCRLLYPRVHSQQGALKRCTRFKCRCRPAL